MKSLALKKVSKYLFWIFIFWATLRIFIFQLVSIPSNSMQPILNDNDIVYINKLSYGARLPITPLATPIAEGNYLDWIKIPYLRFFGYSAIKRNDVIVFNLPSNNDIPIDQKNLFIKRCVAIAGDTLLITNSSNYINNKSARAKLAKKYSPNYFPNNAKIKWDLQNFGPVYIPQKNAIITLNDTNFILYQSIINSYENSSLKRIGSAFYVNDKIAKYYTFKNNYYFMQGDNSFNSIDSRYWGFVPENHIIGKASLVIYSQKTNGYCQILK